MCYLLGDLQYFQYVSGRKLPALARFSRDDMNSHQAKVCGLTGVVDRLKTISLSTAGCSGGVSSSSEGAPSTTAQPFESFVPTEAPPATLTSAAVSGEALSTAVGLLPGRSIKDGLLVDLWSLESRPVSILVPCDGR